MTFIGPDGLTGALMAAEGIPDAAVLLHGPGGCRFRYMRLARELYGDRGGDSVGDVPYYFGNPRIPCTFLGESGYIGGGAERLSDALGIVSERSKGPIAVVPSPAAALIGDDMRRVVRDLDLEDRAVVMDFNPSSLPVSAGFDAAMAAVVGKTVSKRGDVREDGVCLLGLPILCKDWRGTLAELRRLLSMMDLEVVCTPGAGSSSEEIGRSASAAVCIPAMPEFCRRTSAAYQSGWDVGCADVSVSPVGLDATAQWAAAVAEATGRDPSPVLDEIASVRREFKGVLGSDPPRARAVEGMTVSMDGQRSIVLPLAEWLRGYLSIIPRDVSVDGIRLETEVPGMPPMDAGLQMATDIMAGPGDHVALCKANGGCSVALDLGFPPARGFGFRSGTLMGTEGARNILDAIYSQI